MKIFIRGAAAALALSLVGVSGAEAQLDYVDPNPGCDNGSQAIMGWDACDGLFEGNDNGESEPPRSAVTEYINSIWGPGFTDQGVTDAGESGGPFMDFPEELHSGLLTFSFGSFTGDFVLSLKSANQNGGGGFSLYRFDDVEDWTTVSFSTLGVGDKALSHAGLWTRGTVTVPEPGTMLLLGTGLLGMAFARRREDDIEA